MPISSVLEHVLFQQTFFSPISYEKNVLLSTFRDLFVPTPSKPIDVDRKCEPSHRRRGSKMRIEDENPFDVLGICTEIVSKFTRKTDDIDNRCIAVRQYDLDQKFDTSCERWRVYPHFVASICCSLEANWTGQHKMLQICPANFLKNIFYHFVFKDAIHTLPWSGLSIEMQDGIDVSEFVSHKQKDQKMLLRWCLYAFIWDGQADEKINNCFSLGFRILVRCII